METNSEKKKDIGMSGSENIVTYLVEQRNYFNTGNLVKDDFCKWVL